MIGALPIAYPLRPATRPRARRVCSIGSMPFLRLSRQARPAAVSSISRSKHGKRRYSRFLASEGASEVVLHPADPPQAADFLLTIAGLARRRGAFTRSLEESKMVDPKHRQRVEHAIRSVLVAADQRCPAIIGQAHVLYHGAMGGSRCNIGQALRQLRLEAENLLKSIADTEAEMSTARSEFLDQRFHETYRANPPTSS